jgi:CRP/FNR family transcriptional regulator
VLAGDLQKMGTLRNSEPFRAVNLLVNCFARPFEHEQAQYPFPSRISQTFLQRLKASAFTTSSYPKNATLFEDGQRALGFYVMLEGRAKLFMDAAHGKSLILGFFGPGTTLGVEAAILGREHISTAKVVTPAKVAFVNRTVLLEHLRSDAIAALDIARLMSEACYFAVGKMRALDLSPSAEQKLARFLLELTADGARGAVMLDISQEAVAQMLGLARETVARLISNLRRRGILHWKRPALIIQDRPSLAQLAHAYSSACKRGGPLARSVDRKRAPSSPQKTKMPLFRRP